MPKRVSPLLAPDEDTGRVGRGRPWQPNMEPDTELACGCFIPWPITCLLGDTGTVMCGKHGWQPRIPLKEVKRSEKLIKTFTVGQGKLDDYPF